MSPTISRTIVYGTIIFIVLSVVAIPTRAETTPRKPNIVVILADDLGYGDVQCYNPERGKIPTPQIDRLASQGMRFTDAHSSSGVCSPSRYTLLTGRYHWRTRLQTWIVPLWGKPLIAPDRMTIGTLAKQHGYRTAAIGKWHLGWDWPITPEQRQWLGAQVKDGVATEEHRRVWQEIFSQPIPGGPTTRGFDAYFGTDVPNWPPYCFIENDRTVGIPSELLPPEKFTGGEWLASIQGPAFPGWEFEPILPTLVERAERFIAESAAKSEPFLLYMPLTTPHTPIAPNEEWRGKSDLKHLVADLIMETDAVVGHIVDALEKAGQTENTLLLFTSDNGFAHYVGAKELESQGHFPSGPLRGYKGDVCEGGHRMPFVVRWPKVVKPNTVNHQLIHHADFMATLADILGSQLPDDAGEDGFSILPLLQGKDKVIREHAVSCATDGTPGVRQGDWKLIVGQKPQLYNLADDLGEKNDLAGQHPDRVEQMFTLYEKIVSDGRSNSGPVLKNDVALPRRR